MHHQSPQLTIAGTVLEDSAELDLLGVTFDSNMSFEKQLNSVSRAASQRQVLQQLEEVLTNIP